jgi:predicted RNase H-like nuclease (RuvC/YqgF family)
MGRKRSTKQLEVLSTARSARHPHGKENIVPAATSPPRSATRTQAYFSTLQDRIERQSKEIQSLTASNTQLQSENSALHAQLDVSDKQILALETEHTTTLKKLSDVQSDFCDAYNTIDEQETTIKQFQQRINRLMRDKSVLLARISSLKQDVLQAVSRADAEEKMSASQSLRISRLLSNIAHLEDTVLSNRRKHNELAKALRATQMRETRAKTSLETTRETIRSRSKWSGMKGRMYSSHYRTLALAFTRAGCTQAQLGPLLSRVAKVFNVNIKHSMSRRTVGRVVTEARIKVRLQLGHELVRTKGEALI